MSCQGCEARREWIRKQVDEAKRRTKVLLQRLAAKDSGAKQSVDSAKQSAHSDQQ
ncbi:hypothetical protein J538_1169 [Acinetobacter sp. 272263]|nr:hypothetical protein J538_1169 [Acinetobacter sp. 272263]